MTLSTETNVAAATTEAPAETKADVKADAAPAVPDADKDADGAEIAEGVRAVVKEQIEKDKARESGKKKAEEQAVQKPPAKKEEVKEGEEEPESDTPTAAQYELVKRAERLGVKGEHIAKVPAESLQFFVERLEEHARKSEAEAKTEQKPPVEETPAEEKKDEEFKPLVVNTEGFDEDTKGLVNPLVAMVNQMGKRLQAIESERTKEVKERQASEAKQAEAAQQEHDTRVMGFFNHSIAQLPAEERSFFGEKLPEKGMDEYKAREEMWGIFEDLWDLNDKAAKPATFAELFERTRAIYLYPKMREVAIKGVQNKVKQRSRAVTDPPSGRKNMPPEAPPSYREAVDQAADKIGEILAREK